MRKAEPDDFLAIAALDREAWKDNRHPEFIPDGEHVWRVWVEHALVYCAVEGLEIGGVILAFPCLGGAYFLHKVFVAKARRGQGLASRLFQVLLSETDRLGVDLILTVDPANAAARRLYAQWGFAQERLVRGYYREHEDRYVMRRPAGAALVYAYGMAGHHSKRSAH